MAVHDRAADALVLGQAVDLWPGVVDGLGCPGGGVGAGVVDHDDVVDELGGRRDHGAHEKLLVVRRDDHGDAQVPVHAQPSSCRHEDMERMGDWVRIDGLRVPIWNRAVS